MNGMEPDGTVCATINGRARRPNGLPRMPFPSWRNLFRFRLRTLLIVVTLVSIWLGYHVHRTRIQKESVAAIRQYGGWVRYDFQFPSGDYSHAGFDPNARSIAPLWLLDRLGIDFFHDVVQVNLNYSEDSGKREENHNPSDEALQHLEGLPKLRTLLLSDTQASDEGMRHLAGLKRLECLMMWDVANVSDAGVAHLRGLKNLRYIHLTTSKITDRSLEVFAKLPNVDGLTLQFNHFTDAGVAHVADMQQLKTLWLCGRDERRNEITDASLKRLANLKNLKQLGIQSTRVTPAGIAAFSKALPNCEIIKTK